MLVMNDPRDAQLLRRQCGYSGGFEGSREVVVTDQARVLAFPLALEEARREGPLMRMVMQ